MKTRIMRACAASCFAFISTVAIPSTVYADNGGGRKSPARVEAEPVVIDLLERFPASDSIHDMPLLEPDNSEHAQFFVSGWHGPMRNDDGVGYRWSASATPALELPVVRPADRLLTLQAISPPKHDRLPKQTVTVLWNGHELARRQLELGYNKFELQVPAEIQVSGLNRVELLPGFWFAPNALNMGSLKENLGFQIRDIRLELADGAMSRSGASASYKDADAVWQAAESAISFAIVAPKDGVLRGVGSLAGIGARSGESTRLRVAIADPSGGQTVLHDGPHPAAADVGNNEATIELECDLSPWAGELIAITVSFWVDGDHGGHPEAMAKTWLRWDTLNVTGARTSVIVPQTVERERPNILVVLYDALRADHIGPYNAQNIDTPVLNALADKGVVFEDARAATSWTLTSVASMFTGMHPTVHNVITKEDTLGESAPYLPEILQQAGYRTFGYSRNGFISNGRGFGRGFDVYHDVYKGKPAAEFEARKTPEERAALTWDSYVAPFLAEEPDKPFFMYFHEIDPHHPYTPPAPYDTKYTNGYRSAISTENEAMALMNAYAMDLAQSDIDYLNGLYKGEIAFMDGYLGWMLDKLEDEGLRENTLVVFVSDHGDEFWEHGRLTHAHTLYEELIHVPWIMSLPGTLPQGRRIQTPAHLIDLPATLLDLTGVDIPNSMQGQSQYGLAIASEMPREVRPIYANLFRPSYRLDAVALGNWKLIRHTDENGELSYSLYDLQRDPAETFDYYAQEDVVGRCLRQLLACHDLDNARKAIESGSLLKEEDLDEATRENLRALGYLN